MGMQVFDYFARDPETATIFHDAMTGFSTMTGHAVAGAYDFGSVKKLIDVGGGHGAMAEAIAGATPGLEALVYDLPEVVKTAPARKGVAFEGGDFLERVPEGADAYIMKFILHDWDDARSERILRNCAAGLRPGGKILVVEQVVSDAPEAAFAKIIDLEMLVMTPGGRERTEPEFRALFERAGLTLTRIVPTPSPVRVIEAARA
jgi:SAM-dependent methyltransferase